MYDLFNVLLQIKVPTRAKGGKNNYTRFFKS